MRHPVEHPVTDDQCGEDDGSTTASDPASKDETRHRGPTGYQQQAVRPRIVIEGERRERRVSRSDPRSLHAGEQEERPDEIGQLAGGEEPAERDTRRSALGGEGDSKVAEEHARECGIGACWVRGGNTENPGRLRGAQRPVATPR